MAARFAVATGNWSGAIWAATAGGAAGSAAVPTAADDATINKNVVVTIDDTTAVCLSLTLSVGTTGADVGGKIKASTAAHSKLTVQGSITSTGATGGGGTYSSFVDFDQSASAFNFDLVLNNVRATGAGNGLTLDGNFVIKGKPRKRHTLTTGALTANSSTSVGIVDATGWAVGDQLVFATTQAYNATPRTDKVTIATITPGTPPAATVTWTDGAGTGGAVLYDHATACVVGNFSSNVRFAPNTAGDVSWLKLTQGTGEMSQAGYLNDVLFNGFGGESVLNSALLIAQNANLTTAIDLSNNAFWDHRQNCFSLQTVPANVTRNFNVFYSENQSDGRWAVNVSSSQSLETQPDADVAIFRGKLGIKVQVPGQQPVRALISGLTQAGSNSGIGAIVSLISPMTFTDCDIWSCNTVLPAFGVNNFDGCTFGTKYSGAINNTVFMPNSAVIEATDCNFQTGGTFLSGVTSLPSYTEVALVNKNGDSAVQEIYRNHSNTVPVIQRATDTINRSTSSVLMTCNASSAIEHSFEVLAKAGETIRVIGFVMKSGTPAYGASTLPKITISGLGITPVVATMSAGTAADSWEQLTLDATNSGASDGLLTVTFTAQSATAGAKAWFSGIPVAPLVSRCRHYGYTFDETNPVRATNITTSANEATAAAYTGMAVTWGASSSSVAVTTSNTLQKLYDYTQAQGCLNVGMAMPLTGAGVAGSPALFAADNITVADGAVLNGSGSLSMGSKTLSTEFASGVNYTFTGGTWSQLTTVPGFSGGTLNIGATGTYVFAATDTIISMTPAAPGTYAMGGITAGGTLNLRNTTAYAITVELPSGTGYTTASNTGGVITVTVPTVERGLAFTGLVAGSFVRVVKDADQSQLFVDTNSATSEIWNDATSGSLAVSYMIQKAGYEPIGPISVTVTGAVGTGVQAVPVNQVIARWYQASSGLAINTNAFANATTKRFGLTAASTLQNFASYLLEQWIALGGTGGAFANKPFPIEASGPNSFSWLDGWEADLTTYPSSISLLSRDGMRYLNSSGTATATWAALLSNGVPAGKQVRYQQADGTGTTNALTTGNIDQLIKIYGDATHDNFDKRNWLVLKVQTLGDYDQAEADAVVTYGALEDQLYVVGLAPTPNGVPAQAGITGITITSELTPVLWNGQFFSVTIKDTTDTHSGLQIMQYVRGLHEFNWHDMVRANGAKFRTVNGAVYGDTLPTPAGVRVVKADGVTPHPDFDAFSADNGATYAPPVLANISVTGMPDAVGAYNRLQLINSTAKTAAAWQALTAYADGALRLRTSGLGAENTAGLYLRCTTAGTSGALEPVWNTTPGGTTTDGSVTWMTCKVLFYSADPANTAYAASYTEGNEFLAGETIEIRFSEMNAGTSFKSFGTTTIAGSSGFSVAVNEQANDVFATYGLNGASYETTFSPNYVGNYIVLDTNTDFSGKAAFAYFCYLLTTDAGMYDFWGGMTALDAGNIRIETDILNLYFDESAGFVKQTDDVRIYRKDGLRPALDPTTGGFGIEINWRTPVSVVSTGGSALTAAQDAKLMGLNPPAAATIVDAVWAKTLP